jgi:ATP-dependent helicase/nuclease subunit B
MGFTARLRMEKVSFTSNYDHLSRYGEWDETSTPVKQILE